MSKEITTIKNELDKSPLLIQVLGQNKKRYILGVMAEISKSTTDSKKDLTKCTIESIINAIKQSYDLELEIDSRQHCHLIRYNKKIQIKDNGYVKEIWIAEAALQIGYRGFIYAIKRAYSDVNIKCGLVYKGDIFTLKEEGDLTNYSLSKKNPFTKANNSFNTDFNTKKDKIVSTNLEGGFCFISYICGKRLVSFCETMNIEEINNVRNCAKSKSIWNSWFEEKAKVTLIRRGCKIHFSGIEKINKMEEFDNQNFDFNNINDVSKTSNIPDNVDFKDDTVEKTTPKKESEKQEIQKDLEKSLLFITKNTLEDNTISIEDKRTFLDEKKSQIEKLPEYMQAEINSICQRHLGEKLCI